jgi:septum formation protein
MDNLTLVLGSKSPRRQSLIRDMGFRYRIHTSDVEEIYPSDIELSKVPEFLSELKSIPLIESLQENEVLITSDTIVLFENQILGKPLDRDHAIEMLRSLSGKKHDVITGVCLQSISKKVNFSTLTSVYFSHLRDQDIIHYVDTFEPFDKAGSYGIQEWIGLIGVQKIEGCYYNVMGLPVHDIFQQLQSEF